VALVAVIWCPISRRRKCWLGGQSVPLGKIKKIAQLALLKSKIQERRA
jgi:hypothetical protein